MGAGASALPAASSDDVKKAVGELSDADRAKLMAALQAAGSSGAVGENKKNIAENEATLHALHGKVMGNKCFLYKARAMVEENRNLILQNYTAAFVGNRQMANQNTDDIFRNRMAILKAMKIEGPVQQNFLDTKKNEAKIEYLENRSLLNNRVAKVNEKMSQINAQLIEVNDTILKSNEEIVAFNSAQIETNTKLLSGIKEDKCTPEANATRIAENKKRIDVIVERCKKYTKEKVGGENSGIVLATENRKKIIENTKDIMKRRVKIEENRAIITENAKKVSGLIRA